MNIRSFSTYLKEEADKTVIFSFGRLNPPTVGHLKLLDKLASVAKKEKGTYRMYLSQTQDKKKNPLSYTDKVKFSRKMFPKHARNIMLDTSVKTALDALGSMYDQGFNRVIMVVGSDRIAEFDGLLNKYNGVKSTGPFYNFQKGVEIVSAGDRDPDAEGVSGMSASKMRKAVEDHDFVSFSKGLPSNYKDGKKLYNSVRSGMGLKESFNFRRHVSLEKVSNIREKYIEGALFVEGDKIQLKEDKSVRGFITYCGANYVIFEDSNVGKTRAWIHAIKKI